MQTSLVMGLIGYSAGRFIFDASQTKALVWGVGLAFLGYYVANLTPGHANSVDLSPNIG